MSGKLYRIEELKDMLQCATSTIYRWMEIGVFPRPIKIGGLSRWPDTEIEKFLETARQSSNDLGPRPQGIQRGRPTHSRNKRKPKG